MVTIEQVKQKYVVDKDGISKSRADNCCCGCQKGITKKEGIQFMVQCKQCNAHIAPGTGEVTMPGLCVNCQIKYLTKPDKVVVK